MNDHELTEALDTLRVHEGPSWSAERLERVFVRAGSMPRWYRVYARWVEPTAVSAIVLMFAVWACLRIS